MLKLRYSEDSVAIIHAKIIDIVDGSKWWYPACKCLKSVVAENGTYYCPECSHHVFNVSPRYKLQVEVNDGSASCVFILFDSDVYKLTKRTCSDLLGSSESVASDDDYPLDFKSLIGRTLLFKVVNTVSGTSSDSVIYKVRTVCDDPSIISMYELPGIDVSPIKAYPFSCTISTGADLPCSSEAEQASAFVSDLICTPVSLGDDCTEITTSSSSVKRKLEPEFSDDAVLSSIAKKRVPRSSKKANV
ncbi:hypothetical protein RIF29_33778 [Crotalaria pallida]|uniref:Replication factor A C-terminal domain-containing protein n=1 Tax=Crotalaria pallida TaxID=3830 RepID=A0AAN9E9E3_CROPI